MVTRGHSTSDCHILTDYIPHNPLPGLITDCMHLYLITSSAHTIYVALTLTNITVYCLACNIYWSSVLPCLGVFDLGLLSVL